MNSAILFLFIIVLVIGLGLIVVIALTRRPGKTLRKEDYQKQWLAIELSLSDDVNAQQFAIIQADKLLDKALKEKGFGGETMGERLASSKSSFSNIQAVWSAHKLRNKISHEDTVKINRKLTSQALGSFKRGLRDLGAL